MKKLSLHLTLSSFQLKFCLGILLLLNLLMLVGTWAARTPSIIRFKQSLQLLDISRENTISTWYSSMLLLLISIMCAICYKADWERFQHWREKYLSYGWLLLSLIFITLSLDEIGSFHETIGDSEVFNVMGGTTGWTVFYTLIALVGVFMFTFSVVRLLRSRWSAFFAVLGLLLFLSNPLQEIYEVSALRSAPDPDLWVRPIWLLLLEEGSEIFASTCFLISTISYALHITKHRKELNSRNFKPHVDFSFYFTSKNVLFFLTSIIILLTCGVFIVQPDANESVVGGDNGIPKNWFPSAIAFIVFVVSLYIYQVMKKADTFNSYFYLWLALVSVCVSLYYGSNLYAHYIWLTERGMMLDTLMELLSMVASVVLGFRLIILVKSRWSQALTIAWLVFLYIAISLDNIYSAEFAFVAYACLLFALTAHVQRWQPNILEPRTNSLIDYSYKTHPKKHSSIPEHY